MKLVFFNNVLNHHQVNVADEFYQLLGEDYAYVSTSSHTAESLKGGIPFERPYLITVAQDITQHEYAMRLARESDVCVFGMSSLTYAIERAKHTNKLSFELGERWLKKGLLNLLSPHFQEWWWTYQMYFRKKNFYKLCSSGFAALDHQLVGTYINRCYKWGYFTKVDKLSHNDFTKNASLGKSIRIMWCSRLISCKHPELPVIMANRLKEKGYPFVLDIYGTGVLEDRVRMLIQKLGLQDVVRCFGSLPNDQILNEMRAHSIFLFTSDQQEGWGAVANEAMSCGCALVASDKIGSTPYLISNGYNGLTFKSGDVGSLTEKVEWLLNNPDKCIQIQAKAMETMNSIWNAKVAARNLLTLIDDINNGRETTIMVGPCSKA